MKDLASVFWQPCLLLIISRSYTKDYLPTKNHDVFLNVELIKNLIFCTKRASFSLIQKYSRQKEYD